MAVFDARGPWAIELPARQGAAFHAVVAGTCWFTTGDAPAHQLGPGDLVLLPAGARHQLSSDPGLPTRRFDEGLKRSLIRPDGELVLDGPGARTRILCAGYQYATDVTHPVLGLLPPVLHVAAAHPDSGPWLRSILDLLAHETRSRAATGSGTAALRLLDLLLIHVVRAWLDTEDVAMDASWLKGLRDPLIAQVLGVLHERPGDDWTLDTLAATVNVSRATLSRRFTHHVGEPPLTYLTRWRLDVAAHKLRDTTLPIAAIAHDVGYTSEFAFNRAFARTHGQPPGRYRRHAATNRQAESVRGSTPVA
ncbi:AraC family transcriptional regulator [Actinoplanes ianthinogenes]|uniref:AraC family transcriptional regulator n=2 Tax=Actinoplanes ianthinogenes TaxID=122358 RepID=A0ABN6CLZ3_9ACTN|nr:AraC family transcriptional regulator [Actinoplanes ianthinogenes]GGR26166.1 AraC family transcriptional regulator [Actinoplanes ianthinogenes]